MQMRILGSVPLSNGSGYGSERPKNIPRQDPTEPDLDADQEHWFKVKKKSQNSKNQGFSYQFCLMMEGSGARSVLVTNGSGCGSGRPNNIRIRIHNTGIKEIKQILFPANTPCTQCRVLLHPGRDRRKSPLAVRHLPPPPAPPHCRRPPPRRCQKNPRERDRWALPRRCRVE
jgi:hypothetical protein